MNVSARNYLFVVGVPRSGTTALAELLNDHEQVCLGVERYKARIGRPEFGPEYFARDRFFDFQAEDTNILPAAGNKWQRIYETMRAKYDGAGVVGDKVPNAYQRVRRLLADFPASRVVYCLREIDGVARSWDKRAQNTSDSWPETNDYRKAVDAWNRANRLLLSTIRIPELAPRILILAYEPFFGGAPGQLERLCRFLELPATPAFAESYRARCEEYQKLSTRAAPQGDAIDAYVSEHHDPRAYRALLRVGGADAGAPAARAASPSPVTP